ncbi:MAG: T9SS type A sorting domain-containing protein [Flavobacteriales bacterium]|jgi:uncharacterized repeat protein (TIGR01451 family)|nr:T9SS type A sorting domain-containing protein [Flavobacteriales bacterium]
MRIITTTIGVLTMAMVSLAQHPAVSWARSFGGGYTDMGNFIGQRADSSFFLVASSYSTDGQFVDGTGTILLMKLDSEGQFQSGVRIGGPYDRINDGAMMIDSNYVLTGRFLGPEVPDPWNLEGDIGVVKVSPDGNIIWQHTYGGSGDDQGMSVAARPDGGCLVVGTYGEAVAVGTAWDTWAIALDADGNEIWQRTWGGLGVDLGMSIAPTTDGGAIVAGTIGATNGDVSLPSGADWNIRLVKLDASGNTEWEKTFGGSNPDQPGTVLPLSDGGYLLVPESFTLDGDIPGVLGTGGVVVFRLDSLGEVVWEHRYGGIGAESGHDIIKLGDNFLITATTTSPVGGDVSVRYDTDHGDGWLLIIDPDGELLWENTYGGSSADWPRKLALTTDGFAVTGSSISSDRFVPGNVGDQDIWAMRFQNRSSLVGGTLYVDADADSALGPNDPRIAGRLVATDQYDALALTGTDGRYQFEASSPGNITTTGPSFPYFTPDPASHTVNLVGIGQTVDSLDFRYAGMLEAQDLQVFVTPTSTFRPGFSVRYDVLCRNMGTIPVDATLTVMLGDSIALDSSSPAPSGTSGNTLTWALGELAPLQSTGLQINGTLSENLTLFDHVVTTVQIDPIAGDLVPEDNIVELDDQVVGSWDPNDIQVDPEMVLAAEVDDAVLDYTVRFQNTGTAEAIDVGVENVLPANADPTSFEFLASSHPVALEYYDFDRKLRFQFSGINLPDSTADEPGSHGFVRYRIRPRAGLTMSDSIWNTAAIYFDNNAPVITNTAVTLIGNSTGLPNDATAVEGQDLWLSPNPTDGLLQLRTTDRLMGALVTVHDALGRVVASSRIISPAQQLDLSKLKSGLYHVVVQQDHLVLGRTVIKL